MSEEWDSVFEMPPLGVELGQKRAQLLDNLDLVAALSGGTLTKRAAAIRARVKNSSIRLGVIGQVKAGKSSVINSLTRRAGLLPSDVNPWTTVVTRLHFGNPSGKTSGAVFRFFNDAEWDRLANRGGRLGELTEGLLEDYKREKLSEQVVAMRARAEERLGAKFNSLLGKAHRFDTVTADLLAHYVAAGDDPDADDPNPTVGRYADITHSAEIFFPQTPFGYPLTLIDTPGVNDPLLIREEITQQSIENCDHFIVVLSAHQTLNRSDMRLIRLLKALNRDRFVVFVNRLDEIGDPAGEFDKLHDKLVDHLKRELDGKEVSVVLGSAAWADFALTGNEALLDRRRLAQFVEARGLAEPAKSLDPTHHIADPARAEAYLASGMQRLMEVVSEMVMQGAAARTLHEASADLLAVVRQAVERAQIRLTLSDDNNVDFKPIATPEEIAGMIASANSRSKDCRSALAETTATVFGDMLGDMAETVDRFNRDSADELLAALKRSRRNGETFYDVDPLRRDLETVIRTNFDRLRTKLIKDSRMFETAVRNQFPDEVAERIKSVKYGTTALSVLQPQMDAIARTISVELSYSWLNRIFGGAVQKAETIQNSIRSQFKTICTEITSLNQATVISVTDRLTEEYRSDTEAQLKELAGFTATGDLYSAEELQNRKAAREQVKVDLVTAERLVEALAKAQNTASKDEQAA
jgi:GTPase SAR1 family protein